MKQVHIIFGIVFAVIIVVSLVLVIKNYSITIKARNMSSDIQENCNDDDNPCKDLNKTCYKEKCIDRECNNDSTCKNNQMCIAGLCTDKPKSSKNNKKIIILSTVFSVLSIVALSIAIFYNPGDFFRKTNK